MSYRLISDGNLVYISGLEEAQIGAGSMENSVMACYHYYFDVIGEDFSYCDLMAISGSAFRFQFHKEMCPSSPHANCGYSTYERLHELIPWKDEHFEKLDRNNPDDFSKIWGKVKESIDNKTPVIMASEENGLIIGYDKDDKEFITRPYATKPGYYPMDSSVYWNKWPWVFLFPQRVNQDDFNLCETIPEIVATAVMLYESESFEDNDSIYYSSKTAFEKWIDYLKNEEFFNAADDEKIKSITLANGHIYYNLLDSRECAFNFLKNNLHMFPADLANYIVNASKHYEELLKEMKKDCPTNIAPIWFMLKENQKWDQACRNKQIAVLEKVLEHDMKAYEELKKANDML